MYSTLHRPDALRLFNTPANITLSRISTEMKLTVMPQRNPLVFVMKHALTEGTHTIAPRVTPGEKIGLSVELE